jgi:hypothetical protein
LNSADTLTAEATQVERWEEKLDFSLFGGGSTKAVVGTTTMQWVLTISDDWCIGAVVFKAAPAPITEAGDVVKELIRPFNMNMSRRR